MELAIKRSQQAIADQAAAPQCLTAGLLRHATQRGAEYRDAQDASRGPRAAEAAAEQTVASAGAVAALSAVPALRTQVAPPIQVRTPILLLPATAGCRVASQTGSEVIAVMPIFCGL